MSRYATLVQILDRLCSEAPKRFKRYHPEAGNQDALDQARARAFIHLYLKVKFGILEFEARENFVTDDGEDGGIDAYYIDKENKCVHVIQSKFRTSEKNFEEKEITQEEILKIEADRIVKGELIAESGNEYNGKINGFQRALRETNLITQYKYRIVVLANLKSPLLLDRLYRDSGYEVEIFAFDRTYMELCFPVVSGSFFTADSLHIHISLENTNSSNARVNYTVNAFDTESDVTLIFAPTKEIGRIMSKYRNSILAHNPRSFLGLKNNAVNSDIEQSVVAVSNNQFALFNNGITIIADEAGYSDKTGRKNAASLELKNPQIINGGQTAYTLCKIHDDVAAGKHPENIFDGKEVLLKIICIDPGSVSTDKRLHIIEKVSRATNFQTPVEEADRRSNEDVQISLQRAFFEKYGLFYERKAGEFYDGQEAGYISKDKLVDRDVIVRVILALDYQISETRARVSGLFEGHSFSKLAIDPSNVDRYAFSYACYQEVMTLIAASRRKDASNRYFSDKYGNALRYGRFAIVGIAGNQFSPHLAQNPKTVVEGVLSKWNAFEKHAEAKVENGKYFSDPKGGGWVGYFKGDTINSDLRAFFTKKENNEVA